jgi:hypothetical protein
MVVVFLTVLVGLLSSQVEERSFKINVLGGGLA